ncbi:methyltransferase [Pseudomaricurvus sp. HS19]|uniref:methyltransferase n=1 Tax=Pseudomaricurvus sp. HS19 TaxID=2692626 RepID=UPI00136F99C8|nr:methyltransferase [Pseudomaricurvus sp. HS19]MYM64614.1 methyltransferase [Pseudomaricurvus sp. HS19]
MSDLDDRFRQLDRVLAQTARWWQPQLFHSRHCPWRQAAPDLAEALERLSDEELSNLQAQPGELQAWLHPWLPELALLSELERVPACNHSLPSPSARLEVGVPGRKWQQLQHFAAAWQGGSEPLLEWCAGKGHLGRLLAQQCGCAVTSLEWQEALCGEGQQLAQRHGLQQQFVCGDALQAASGELLALHPQAVALHACGDLHRALLQHWCSSDSLRLGLVPCCYHLTADSLYVGLSAAARQAQVRLRRVDLSLPQRETVTAGEGQRQRRHTEMVWRMAFDEWQREQRGWDVYLPVPSVPYSLLKGEFTDYLRLMAARRHVPVTGGVDAELWLQRGAERYRKLQRWELVQQLFRRPLELWLLLDRALYLQESGARVSLLEFCPRELTPRNLMLLAER